MIFREIKAMMNIGFKTALVYRFHFITTLVTAPVILIIYYFLWNSVYAYSGAEVIRGFTLNEMIAYYALTMIVGFFAWSFADEKIEEDVKLGLLTPTLLRPISYLKQAFLFEFGLNMLSVFVEMIPVLVISFMFFKIPIPQVINGIYFVISIIGAMVIYFLLSFLLGMTAFWFYNISGLRRVRRTVMSFFAGSFIPLTFFPETLQKIFHFLPFEYTRYVPVKIYLGHYSVLGGLGQLAIQAFWIIVFYAVIRLIWDVAYKKFAGSGV